MTQPTEQYLQMERIVSEAYAQAGEQSSIDRVCARLRSRTRQLRQYYLRQNSDEASRAPQDEWLCDNYYVLEKESKQAVRDIRMLARKAEIGELERMYHVLYQVLLRLMPPVSDETFSDMILALSRLQPVSEKQFSFLPAAVKAIMVEMAWIACLQERSEEKIRYAIIGLSRLSAVDLDGIIQSCSGVEQILMQDPAGVYPDMTRETRRHYRHLVSLIAARTHRTEEQVALDALQSCRDASGAAGHIGYPLLHSQYVRRPGIRRGRAAISIGILLPLLLSVLIGMATGSLWMALLCWLPMWEICRTPVQHLAQAGADTDFLPRMNLRKIKERPKSVVLVSTLLPKAGEVRNLEQRLEQLYFSNSDPDMYYCVLADFSEWQYPTDEKDESQIRAVRRTVEKLNSRHGDRFMLFLRARTWNRSRQKYSGWERKRGAITDFVRFVKGEQVALHTFEGNRDILSEIRFLITLDADTNLLYESAQTLVSAAIHPLNRPVISEDGIVVDGYGILAPKISADLNSARATVFSRIMTGCGGVTAYDTRDRDFYQDLFGESIFAGKGLIDVDSFHRLLVNRFPENHILSHDILEGAYLRVGFVSDAEMTDCAPSAMASWLARLHRWIRGDWQNTVFIGRMYRSQGRVWRNPISALSRYKLFDNLRRSLTPAAALLCLAVAAFVPAPLSGILIAAGILAVTFSSLWAAAFALLTGGVFTLARKFFTKTLPHTLELVSQAAFFLIMLPAQAFVTADAVVRALWRTFVSHKNMLEWTTAAQSELSTGSWKAMLKRFWLPELFGLAYLLLAPGVLLRILGLAFLLVMPVAFLSAKPSQDDRHTLNTKARDKLISYNAAMWRYYEDFSNRENNWLPPDNIQQSPVYRVANRTSPTNIGMMMLSILAARDFDFIDTDGLYRRIDRTLATVEKLEKWHGNLYNWYDTITLQTLKPEFVSTVDSGNFVCCLVALSQGLREFVQEKQDFKGLIERLEALVEATDLTVFYNSRKKLFSIGYDMDTGLLSESHYDFLMSEARLTSYYAVARKTVGKRHWGTLTRTMSRSGSYAGAVSWTGTMFEYFMPHLLLPVYEGSLLGEALWYCLYCQKRRVRGRGIPWGISESAFYAFDNHLNYQYKAHGVQKLGVKRYLDRELVISPYSTFITIPFNPNSSMRNLEELQHLGVYGRYGFYEAVDFTDDRVGAGAPAVTRSYMAHHIGMSMVASCNALFENRMQKRFMRDNYMKSANEFLQEKITKNTVIYDELGGSAPRSDRNDRRSMVFDQTDVISPQCPRCAVLTNGEITDVLTDTGAGYLKFGGIDVTRRETDLLRRAQGIFTLVRMGGNTISATSAPFYQPQVDYSVEYERRSVTYYAARKDMEIGVRCMMHPTISCEQRQIVVKNTSGQKQLAQVLVYFEPTLSSFQDYSAHPAYSKLFVSATHDRDSRTLTFSRRNRDSTVDLYLTAGFLQDIDFSFETRREHLQSAPNGLNDLLFFHERTFSNNGGGVPDACCAFRFDLLVPAGGQAQATLLLCAARTQAEGVSAIISMRKIGALTATNAAKSPLLGDSLEARLGSAVLGQVLYHDTVSRIGVRERKRNQAGQSTLWCTGISGDLPIALFETTDAPDVAAVQSYLRLHASLRSIQIEFDLVFLLEDDSFREELIRQVRQISVEGILNTRGGIFVLEKKDLSEEVMTLLRAAARHMTKDGLPDTTPPATDGFRPVEIRTVEPEPMPERSDVSVEGGSFHEGRFYVQRNSHLPYCHILSNPVFGTMVSDSALGYTWAINARENKLTPWFNDICTDNTGELLLVSTEDGIFNLISGSRASFSERDAVWRGRTNRLKSSVRVTVSETGCAKYLDVTLQNRGDSKLSLQLAWYAEPVLGVSRETAGFIRPVLHGGDAALVLKNPWNSAVDCCVAMAVQSEAESGEVAFTTCRASFLRGNWNDSPVEPGNDPCAAIMLPVCLAPGGGQTVRFVMSYGKTPESALHMVKSQLPRRKGPENSIRIQTGDPHLDAYINDFAAHQILRSRIQGRTAFYQCGGAYGFRDQLQDACAWLLRDPEVARRQIVRCCRVQFEEGDVLHWWHPLPGENGMKGVRTRFSDDLLWLPYAVCDYVRTTEDLDLLNVPVHYIKAELLADGQQEHYLTPEKSDRKETVFEHCRRALEKGLNLDEKGLPKIGCGDWNDGFSAVGAQGKGTSVWLALFLIIVLERFSDLCEKAGQQRAAYAGDYRMQAEALRRAVDEHCWDGEWYVRAFFDSGEPMGAAGNEECSIDLLPQSFAVLANMPDRQRVDMALDHAVHRLLDEELRLVRLFDPAFQHSHQQPGYVRAYPSGIRENGGQYTHAAVWFGLALLKAGRTEDAWRVLQMLNPVERSSHPDLAGRFATEPYYMPADIYTCRSAPGHGGWSIYTGAASWYYRAVLEGILGIRITGDTVRFAPQLPEEWKNPRMELNLRGTKLSVEMRWGGSPATFCDGVPAKEVRLDGGEHSVEVIVQEKREQT